MNNNRSFENNAKLERHEKPKRANVKKKDT